MGRAVIATNAYAHSFPELRRYIFTVYAHILVTEPLTTDQWAKVGWERGMVVEDKRVMPHFHRPTPDGRILWGGRDAPIAPNGPDQRLEARRWVFSRLEETFRWTFPQLDDVEISGGWSGPVCGTVNCFATVGWLGSTGGRIAYSVGYSGHGVGPSHLSAKVLRDMRLGRDSYLMGLPMRSKRPIPLPPNPLRHAVLNASQRVLQRHDDKGGEGTSLSRIALRALQ